MKSQGTGKRSRDQDRGGNSGYNVFHRESTVQLAGKPLTSSVPLKNYELRVSNVRVFCRHYCGQGDRPTVQLIFERVLLVPIDDQCEYAYDLDIASLVRPGSCRRISFDAHASSYQDVSDPAAGPMLIIRKSYLLRHDEDPLCGIVDSHAATLTVDGVVYHIRHCQDVARNVALMDVCVGFPAGSDFADAPVEALQLRKHTRVGPDGAVINEITLAHPALKAGVAVPGQVLDLNRFGGSLISQPYGEVYRGRRLVREGTVYDSVRRVRTVAVKVIRYPNTHLPNAATSITLLDGGPAMLSGLINHEGIQQGSLLTSKDVQKGGYFATLRHAENPMTEVEMARYAADEARRAVGRFRQQPPQLRATLPDPSHLLKRFLPVVEAGISCDNLYLVSPYSPYGSLDLHMERGAPRPNNPLSERAAQHVMRHLLQALAFLHARGVAHLDVSLGNTLLRAPPAKDAAALRELEGRRLSDEHFELLDISLFDFGQSVVHPARSSREAAASEPLALGMTTLSTDPLLACAGRGLGKGEGPEVAFEAARTDSEGASPRSPAPDREQRRDLATCSGASHLSCNSCDANPSDTASCPVHDFHLLPPPARGVAKPSYRPPEVKVCQGSGGEPFCGMCVDMWQLGVLGVNMFIGTQCLNRVTRITFRDRLYEFAGRRRAQTAQRAPSSGPLMGLADSIALLEVPQCSAAVKDDIEWVFLSSLAISPKAMDFLSRLLVYDPEGRMSATEALQHPWVQNERE